MDNKTLAAGGRITRRAGFQRPDHRMTQAFAHLPLSETDMVAMGQAIPYYAEWLGRADLADPFWQTLDHSAGLARATAPAYLVSGWYDILLRELLEDYAVLRAAGRRPYLTIGPWAHTDAGPTLEALRGGLDWFDAHLHDAPEHLRPQPVRIFVMGAGEWRDLDAWPPPNQEAHFFLHAEGQLGETPPVPAPPDHYRYDPADPTPSLG